MRIPVKVYFSKNLQESEARTVKERTIKYFSVKMFVEIPFPTFPLTLFLPIEVFLFSYYIKDLLVNCVWTKLLSFRDYSGF